MKEAAFLLTMQRVVGGIKVQNEFFRCDFEPGDELLDQHRMQVPRGFAIRPVLQAAQRWGARHNCINTDCSLHRYVLA